MPSVISDEQRLALKKSPRFEDMVRASAANYAMFLHENDGVNPPGISQVDWAKQRFFIAESIVNHPNDQDVESWKSMYAMLMRGLNIWEGDVDATLDFMIANNTFEQLANQSFVIRANNVKF